MEEAGKAESLVQNGDGRREKLLDGGDGGILVDFRHSRNRDDPRNVVKHGNFVDQDRISVQVRHLDHGHDAVFGMIQKEIGLAGVVQGDQLDYPFVDIVVCDTGRNGKTAGPEKTLIKIEGFQSGLRQRADTGVGGGAGRNHTVGEACRTLEGHNRSLSGDAGHLSQGAHQGHNQGCKAAA